MTIASEFNKITEKLGGTPSNSGTIASAIDALNDVLAGSDQPAVQTIEGAVALLGEHIGGGSSVTVEALTATENKTYTAPDGTAYSPVTVNVSSGATNSFVGPLVTYNESSDQYEAANCTITKFGWKDSEHTIHDIAYTLVQGTYEVYGESITTNAITATVPVGFSIAAEGKIGDDFVLITPTEGQAVFTNSDGILIVLDNSYGAAFCPLQTESLI